MSDYIDPNGPISEPVSEPLGTFIPGETFDPLQPLAAQAPQPPTGPEHGAPQYDEPQYGQPNVPAAHPGVPQAPPIPPQYGAQPPPQQHPQPHQAPPQQPQGTHPDPAAQPIRVSVAVVDSDPTARERLLYQLGEGGTPFDSIQELASRLTGAVPVVIIMGPSSATPETLAMTEELISTRPSLGAILVVEELSTTLLQSALRSGIRDVLTISGDAAQLASAVQRVAVSIENAPTHAATPQMPPQSQTPDGASGEEARPLGKVTTVFSTKGGAGKSVIATNLAVILAERSDGPVCLVDADLQFGDVAVMLKLAPHHTIVDAVGNLDKMDASLLDSLLVTHEDSGLKVLPAPLEPAFADQVGGAEMVAIVEHLKTFCSHVVVDTPAYFNDVVLGLVEVSDRVVLVAGMDIPNIKNVKIGLQTLRLLNTPMEKLLLVLNRSNSKVKLDISEVERTLSVKAESLIPSDVLVPQSVNKGVPVVQHSPKSSVAKALQQLADHFEPVKGKRR